MDTVQIKGIDSTMRETEADLKDGAKLEISEKLMTHGEQKAETQFAVDLDGEGSSANVVSRSVARNDSYQMFRAVRSQVIMPVPDIANVMRSSWITQGFVRFLN